MNWGDNQKGKGRASKQDRSFLLRFVEFCKILCESEKMLRSIKYQALAFQISQVNEPGPPCQSL